MGVGAAETPPLEDELFEDGPLEDGLLEDGPLEGVVMVEEEEGVGASPEVEMFLSFQAIPSLIVERVLVPEEDVPEED